MKRFTYILVLVLLFVAVSWLAIYTINQITRYNPPASPTPFPTKSIVKPSPQVKGATSEIATVKHVIDGDTIVLQNGEKLRYVGIDTPEIHHPKKPVQCYGQIAADKNRKLLEGNQVRLEKDVSQRDRYGRLLRLVYVQTPQGELFVNDYLVREGYARAVTFPPDVKYSERFRLAEQEARTLNKGLWKDCPL